MAKDSTIIAGPWSNFCCQTVILKLLLRSQDGANSRFSVENYFTRRNYPRPSILKTSFDSFSPTWLWKFCKVMIYFIIWWHDDFVLLCLCLLHHTVTPPHTAKGMLHVVWKILQGRVIFKRIAKARQKKKSQLNFFCLETADCSVFCQVHLAEGEYVRKFELLL